MALMLPKNKNGRTLLTFPRAFEIKGRKEENKMINTLKQLLFAFALVVVVSITASAQKEGDKKPPPKKDPPVIVVTPKNPPKEDKPKSDKKPEAMIFNIKYKLSFM